MPATDSCLPVGIAILAKAPLPGYAKTRLIPVLGAEGAATLQAAMLARTVATALAADIGPVTLWCAPDSSHPAFAEARKMGVGLAVQPPCDLGGRMLMALQQGLPAGGALVIGTDCPALTPQHLQDAALGLRRHDAVFIPAEDGGYVLLGMRRPSSSAFDGMVWSTSRVMAETRLRLAAAGLDWFEFSPLFDVDRSTDLPRLYQLMPELSCNA